MEMTKNLNFFLDQNPLSEYLIDASQRMILFWDLMRQRGNQDLKEAAKTAPQVLQFDYELILDSQKEK